MDSVVYLTRSPRKQISAFLYPRVKGVTVVAVEKTPLPGRVVENGIGCSWEKEATLSYKELFDLLVTSHRIITL